MEKSFISIGGKEYRVEANWNALSNFLKAVGRDTLEGLSDISAQYYRGAPGAAYAGTVIMTG